MKKSYKYFVPIAVYICMYRIGYGMIAASINTYNSKLFTLSRVWGVICLCCTIIAFKLLYKNQPVKKLFSAKLNTKLIVSILCCLIIGVAFNIFNQWVSVLFPTVYDGLDINVYTKLSMYTNTVPYYIYFCIVGPVLEEIIVRGYFVTQCRFEMGYKNAIFLGAVIWGFLHMNVWMFLYVFVMGIILNNIFIETDNLLYTVLIHIGNNVGGLLFSKLAIGNVLGSDDMTKLMIVLSAGAAAAAVSVFLIKYNKPKD